MQNKKNYLFTSEAVSAGHPDKVADQISDAVLDAYFKKDPNAHVACEVLVTRNLVVLAGEVKSQKTISVIPVVRRTIADIGYTKPGIGFAADDVTIINQLHKQSEDIDRGVRQGEEEQGAGDQGMMFGYATNETPDYMPVSLYIANKILAELDVYRKTSTVWKERLMPDAKSQVTIRYQDGRPVAVDTVVVSTMHTDWADDETMQREIREMVTDCLMPDMIAALPQSIQDLFEGAGTKYLVNPTGRFVEGGPAADTGLTGRKIIVDTYGGRGAHGGGAFSGKDPSKVDRSAAYMARFIAKNLVAAGIADEMLVQLSYAIGTAAPVSVMVDTYGTAKTGWTDERIAAFIQDKYDLTPRGIEAQLQLRSVEYKMTAAGGHFGRTPGFVRYPNNQERIFRHFTWEAVDIVQTRNLIAMFSND